MAKGKKKLCRTSAQIQSVNERRFILQLSAQRRWRAVFDKRCKNVTPGFNTSALLLTEREDLLQLVEEEDQARRTWCPRSGQKAMCWVVEETPG